ncbi:DNA-packaging protein [Bradyrhizobium sp. AUGA SZCCT0182]|uniref:DNA-packaging protein n=1 Tax=Bradyrhizobium sp. AUGA SZCCT0182 TaxID=2807667 RepID=UPI001BABA34B|nr:terminase family protein [Bradyrhizobium sp. AUGA SZCCT0182]MBR1238178.1 DNA-packaging protein [Bradyrhizobium sp. AUGA SZCCT0182]
MSLRSSLASILADTLADGGWRAKARPSQLPPDGDWNGWLVMAGRGFGKTRTGAEWVKEEVEAGRARRVAMIAPTAADARDTMVEGESGILSISSDWCRPVYEPSKRKLTWPNGAVAHTFSSEEADRLRGPQFDLAWADELAAWNDPLAAWSMLQFGLRLGRRPRWIATTTPRPLKLIKELLDREGRDVVVTRGSTFENEANLAKPFLDAIRARYEGTRLGRQELNAELLVDIQGALWTRDMIERARFKGPVPDLRRVVVAIDPSGTRGQSDGGDSIGIVVAGIGVDKLGYILADRTCKLSPDGWGKVAVKAYREFKADRIIAERNFGGAMVEHVIRTVDPGVAYRDVTASRGKIARAEPVAALYEQGRVRHAADFPDLEDQLCAMTGDGYGGDGSPDRADALVWALSELMVKPPVPVAQFGIFRLATYGLGPGERPADTNIEMTALRQRAMSRSSSCTPSTNRK